MFYSEVSESLVESRTGLLPEQTQMPNSTLVTGRLFDGDVTSSVKSPHSVETAEQSGAGRQAVETD